jgi:hypothetical protein
LKRLETLISKLLSTEKFRPRQCVWDKTQMQFFFFLFEII